MEMLLAQPVRRMSIYSTHAIVTIVGSALLATAVWCGTAAGLYTTSLHLDVSTIRYLPAATNFFSLMVCIGGLSALASSWDNQRWRTVGLMGALYVVSAVLAIAARISDRWHWLQYGSFLSAYNPQTSVAQPDAAWSLLAHRNGHVIGLGLGGCQLLLVAIGVAAYTIGAIIFARREIPAPNLRFPCAAASRVARNSPWRAILGPDHPSNAAHSRRPNRPPTESHAQITRRPWGRTQWPDVSCRWSSCFPGWYIRDASSS